MTARSGEGARGPLRGGAGAPGGANKTNDVIRATLLYRFSPGGVRDVRSVFGLAAGRGWIPGMSALA